MQPVAEAVPPAEALWGPTFPSAPAASSRGADPEPPRSDHEHAPVTTEELVRAFAEASDLRMRALGAVGLVDDCGGRGQKRRRVDGGRTFHPTIGIGNVGKKGGSDVPGGVQVSMVSLCDYILRHGGWDQVPPPPVLGPVSIGPRAADSGCTHTHPIERAWRLQSSVGAPTMERC